ncbi:lamina-associated polypeptide 2-like isoform X2 [Stigmatopora argus]
MTSLFDMPVLRKDPAVYSWPTKVEPHYSMVALSREQVEDECHVPQAQKPEDGDKSCYSMLTDEDLMENLLDYGVQAGPIVDSTRALYEKKLRKLQAKRGALKEAIVISSEDWSDSSDSSDEDDNEADSTRALYEKRLRKVQAKRGTLKEGRTIVISSEDCSDLSDEDDNEADPKRGEGKFDEQESSEEEEEVFQNERGYPQCVLPSSRMRSDTSMTKSANPSLDKLSKSRKCEGVFKVPNDKIAPSTIRKHSEVRSKVCNKPVQESALENFSITEMVDKKLKEDERVPDKKPARTSINVTCRRPIKGAAGRPIQFNPQKPRVPPATIERREMDHQMMPVHIQFVVFLIVAFLLFVIVESEPFSPLLALVYNAMKG